MLDPDDPVTKCRMQPPTDNLSLLRNVAAPSPRLMMRLSHVDALLRSLPKPPGSFLEIGPGMGDVSHFLVSRFPGIHAHIADISAESINIVDRRLDGFENVSAQVADFSTLRIPGQLDLVVACEVFEHLEDDNNAFACVLRLLADNGHFLFSVPAFMTKWSVSDEYGGHVRRYEREALQQQFADHGFEIVHFWSYGFPVTTITNPIANIHYRRAQRRAPLAGVEATKRSGTERTLARRLQQLPVALLMKPFFWCQHLMRHRDVGDGFVVLARKAS